MVGTVQASSNAFSDVLCRTYERSLISASQFQNLAGYQRLLVLLRPISAGGSTSNILPVRCKEQLPCISSMGSRCSSVCSLMAGALCLQVSSLLLWLSGGS